MQGQAEISEGGNRGQEDDPVHDEVSNREYIHEHESVDALACQLFGRYLTQNKIVPRLNSMSHIMISATMMLNKTFRGSKNLYLLYTKMSM